MESSASADHAAAKELWNRLLSLDGRRNSLVGSIADWAGRAIVEGRLRPGDDLNTVDLAEKFGTSRTPVREALMLLEKQGLVEMQARRRPRVATISIDQVREIYQARGILLALVAELIVANASDEKISSLRKPYALMEKAAQEENLHTYFWANVALHERSAEICGNSTVKRILDSLGLLTLQLRYISLSQPQRMKQSRADHGRLLRAYEERDAILASALIRTIIRDALAAIERSGWTEELHMPELSHMMP